MKRVQNWRHVSVVRVALVSLFLDSPYAFIMSWRMKNRCRKRWSRTRKGRRKKWENVSLFQEKEKNMFFDTKRMGRESHNIRGHVSQERQKIKFCLPLGSSSFKTQEDMTKKHEFFYACNSSLSSSCALYIFLSFFIIRKNLKSRNQGPKTRWERCHQRSLSLIYTLSPSSLREMLSFFSAFSILDMIASSVSLFISF